MAASSLLLLRISEYLRARKSAIASDAAAGCRDEERARQAESGEDLFPWSEKLQTMLQGTADALLARTAHEQVAPPPVKISRGHSGDIQILLSDAWLVRNSFLRALNRFQGEQSNKRVDFTAIEMTEARQEAVQEFDRHISSALSEWIAGSTGAASVPAAAVRDLYHGMLAIQGVLKMAAENIPAAARAHVAAAAQQLGRLAASTQELIQAEQNPDSPKTAIAPPPPPIKRPHGALALAPLDVRSFVHALAEAARPAAQKRAVRIECLCNPGPRILQTDAARLHRAATLLIDSAISYTEQGEVSIVSGQDVTGAWTLEIRDTSAGIPPEILARLLKGVEHAPDDAAAGGNPGLGIALARDLVQLLGGELQASSEPGDGNCFLIVLPI